MRKHTVVIQRCFYEFIIESSFNHFLVINLKSDEINITETRNKT
jgi:hypothetical protein